MAWVTVIGPSDGQVEYRLTGRHGCSQMDAAAQVPAALLVDAVLAKAAADGVEVRALFGSERGFRAFQVLADQVAGDREAQMNAVDAQRTAAAAGLDAGVVFGDGFADALAAARDPEVAYRMDVNERPLMWIGSGVREFGLRPYSELTVDRFDWARAMMKGIDPRTGEVLVAPKVAVDPRGKLPSHVLLAAIRERAAEQGVEPVALMGSARMVKAFGQLERGVTRLGEGHKTSLTQVGRLAGSAGVDPVLLYGPEAVEQAVEFEGSRVVVGNRGYDVTINLPKPFSVLFAFAGESLAAELEEVFVSALKDAVSVGEGWAAYGMRGWHGDGHAGNRMNSSGFIGWVNLHRAARPTGNAPFGDPHLHAHVTLANLCRGEDGQWSTVAAGGRDLHRHASAIDAVMQARVRKMTSDRWGIDWQINTHTHGWEITGIPEETVRLFSKRSEEVKALFEALGIPFAATTSAQQKAAAAAIAGRKTERATSASDAVLREYWRAEADADGQDPDEILSDVLSGRRHRLPLRVDDIAAISRWVFRPDEGLTAHIKSFTRAQAIAAVVNAVQDGIRPGAQAEDLTDRVLVEGGQAVRLKATLPGHMSNTDRYTTRDIIAAERQILAQTRARFGEGAAVVSERIFAMSAATYEVMKSATTPGYQLSAKQVAVLRRLLMAGHGVDTVIGVAGAGKTTIMEVAQMAWAAEGKVVMGASTAAVASANLRMQTGIPSVTIARLLVEIARGRLALNGVDVLVVDEAAMVDDRQSAVLLTHAAATGTKVVGIGDPRQLQSPGVGGSFAAVHVLVDGLTLDTNYRQRDAIERRALAMWRDDAKCEALRLWADRGRVHVADNRDEAMAGIIVAWDGKRSGYTDPHDQIANVLILAARGVDVDELNIAARAVRRAAGELGEHEETYTLRGGGDIAFSSGDVVLVRKNDYRSWRNDGHDDVLNGYRGLVIDIDAKRRVLVEWREDTPDGDSRTVREWVEPSYISRGGLMHGIAMTVHRAQGLSVDYCLVYGVGLATNGAYTALSRDRNEVHLFLPLSEFEDLSTRLRLGDPETPAEELDRAIAAFAGVFEHDQDEPLIVTELGEVIEPVPAARRPGEPIRATLERLDQPSGPQPAHNAAGSDYARIARVVLRDLIDVEELLADSRWPELAEVLRVADDAGHDIVELLSDAALSRSLQDVDSAAAVLAWRIEERLAADPVPAEPVTGDPGQDIHDRQDRMGSAPPASGRNTAPWRERRFGDLLEDELLGQIADAEAAAARADITAAQLDTAAGQLGQDAADGAGPAARVITGRYQHLKDRAEAIAALADAERDHTDAEAAVTTLRAELADTATASGRSGRRERGNGEPVRVIRDLLADAERRLIEIDIARDGLELAAGPVGSRAGVEQQWQDLAAQWPAPLEIAERTDREDADDLARRAAGARARAGAARDSARSLTGEREIRAGLEEARGRAEAVERVAVRSEEPDRATGETIDERGVEEEEQLAVDEDNIDLGDGRGYRL